jgi:hypothetical protein
MPHPRLKEHNITHFWSNRDKGLIFATSPSFARRAGMTGFRPERRG